jgi:hypothetical protein
MTAIIEIRPQVWAVKHNEHTLRQHYFTLQTAQMAAQELQGYPQRPSR